ncbi:methionyl-tRNA formyltransferase, mitochondrial [Coccinella septempunctata]|uniref:methionyl-tRNA formyltransferase, mitochondrial n=1 Tax=Coccinella septempunctata TaxID=41139 RepID=UPI001D073A81|nr:methionyl-tRNA formyltransferase, mitochondrial [Coccinella septempunctata]
MINKKKSIFYLTKLFQEPILPIQKTPKRSSSGDGYKPPWKILFFGADNFSLFSLSALLNEYRKGETINKLEVCTSVKKIKNDVYKFAEKENLRIRQWPPDLSQNEFDTGLVVSFGHLIPRNVIERFPLGMINVHASLLPQWRGAAPIIYCLANGENVTGISVMKIEPLKFDVGKILSQNSFNIPDDMYMPELSNALGALGAKELINCLKDLPNRLINAKPQSENGISYAPKVNPSFAQIDWKNMTSIKIFNLERALRGFLPLTSTWKGEIVKFFNVHKCQDGSVIQIKPGFIIYDDELRVLKVCCADNKYVTIEKVQIFQKKVMSAKDFNNGYLKKTPLEKRYFL